MAAPPVAACALGPGLRAYLTPAALAALREEERAILPMVWRLLDAHGQRGLAPTDHDVGTGRVRVVAGADGAVVLGVIGIDFAGADRPETAPSTTTPWHNPRPTIHLTTRRGGSQCRRR